MPAISPEDVRGLIDQQRNRRIWGNPSPLQSQLANEPMEREATESVTCSKILTTKSKKPYSGPRSTVTM